MANYDLSALALGMVCPTNKLITDDKGMPSVFVQRAKQVLSALLTNGDGTAHPAFMINGEEKASIYIGKFQGKSHGSRMYSLPGQDPTTDINLDTIVSYCCNKGAGHHCITAAEWGFLALLAKKNGTQPKGNNYYGKDHGESMYQAIPSMVDSDKNICRVATGTGPMTWSDNGQIDGIWDLNGNVYEWVAGIRFIHGELQVIPYNNAALPDIDMGLNSAQWKALNAKATGYSDLYIAPDGSGTTSGSVKLDFVSEHWQWDTNITSKEDKWRNAAFASTTCGSGISSFTRMMLEALALCPESGDSNYGDDFFSANNEKAECSVFRGGNWSDSSSAGVFSLHCFYARSDTGRSVGGRPAFYE